MHIKSGQVISQPQFPKWTRYTRRPFPDYRFVPGKTPHPRRDPHGHSYGLPEYKAATAAVEPWYACGDYLYGIDLFNFAYWWESHEVMEALWNAVGHTTPHGRFFQTLVFVSAAHLKRFVGAPRRGHTLARKALSQLEGFDGFFMGIDVGDLERSIRSSFLESDPRQIVISLQHDDSPLA